MNAIYLEPALVPASLRGGYAGKMFKAVVCTEATIPIDAGLWSGGSREVYTAIEFATGRQASFPGQDEAPWGARQERTVKLEPGLAVVRHSMFCGKDMGLTFYLHPANAAQLLPAPSAELTKYEKLVLHATCSFKSSYGGRDRYQMAQCDARYGKDFQSFPTREQWDAAKQSLIAKGLLNKAGAVTVAGRNARH
jgi:hypothetical protein